ncbi:hypothetical protein PRIC1_005468 [Phytophthora ramorum]
MASSATSSTTSSPLSDSATPTRSWSSIIAPRHEPCHEGLATDEPSVAEEDGERAPGQGDMGTESEETARPKRKYPKRKHRKGTHTIRKEEKERLLKEMEILQKEMGALKKRAMDPTFPVDTLVRKSRRQTLQEAVQGHMQKFCKTLSIMSDYTLCVRMGAV